MTVQELITELQALPPDALIVFRHTRDDAPDDYETVDCWHWEGEAFIDIHSGEDDEPPSINAVDPSAQPSGNPSTRA